MQYYFSVYHLENVLTAKLQNKIDDFCYWPVLWFEKEQETFTLSGLEYFFSVLKLIFFGLMIIVHKKYQCTCRLWNILI